MTQIFQNMCGKSPTLAKKGIKAFKKVFCKYREFGFVWQAHSHTTQITSFFCIFQNFLRNFPTVTCGLCNITWSVRARKFRAAFRAVIPRSARNWGGSAKCSKILMTRVNKVRSNVHLQLLNIAFLSELIQGFCD